MRRGLVHLLAWTLATGAAATMMWWGVHTVMAGTAYDPPRALPITVADAAGRKSPAPEPEPRPRATTASPEPTRPTPAPSPTPTASPTSTSTPGATPSKAPSTVKATPGAGWSMQVWKTETWIRVEFGAGADRVTVFCTWHDGPPHVQVLTY
jgi:hypothetical protein